MTLLNVLYDELDFKSGSLFTATDKPLGRQNRADWLEKGEWLSAANRVGAEKIFFVENNPVAVFSECGNSLEEKVKAFNQAWCLARPRLLFLASPGEITVFDLAQKPVDIKNRKEWKRLKNIAFLDDLKKVAQKLQVFHRDNVESGRSFSDKRFGNLDNRADKALIRDLKTVRSELIRAGLSGDRIRFAHALIGRSIFIRYLEDRSILTEAYFMQITRQRSGWEALLKNPPSRTGFDISDQGNFYPRVLADKDFTYALFRKLGRDFNGDMFPDIDEEEQVVSLDHLKLIQDLLYGDVGIQKKLFFHSYRFDIIPLDLISSIYEEFYHGGANDAEKKQRVRQNGAYYTPPVLAEFVISRVLTPDLLEKTPRVLDPACGSGIFLVEAFRRIVRYEWLKKKHALTFDDLKAILKEQIAGIEIDDESARIAAFSLYLSMLHYLDPPAIDQQIKMGNRLPNLVATNDRSANHFHCILHGNAFDVKRIESHPVWKKLFGKGCADVVVGNPPWGAPGTKAEADIKARQETLLDWCKSNDKPIGDKEPSQAFLWRALDFLRENGKAGMLVSAGVLFKHSTTTKAFREKWLDRVRLDEVFNFSHVRKIFFKGVISPFLAVSFKKEKQFDSPVNYWSAKQSLLINQAQSVLLSKNDQRIIHEKNLSDYRIWKLYNDGSHRDAEFLDYLVNSRKTVLLGDETFFSCVGFKKANQQKEATWLASFRKVKKESFNRYGKLGDEDFEDVPSKVEHRGRGKEMYEGQRIVIKEGPRQSGGSFGRIEARYETEPYAYNHSFHVIKLIDEKSWKYRVLVGIFWSSLARYYLFLTSSNWGLWHDKVLINERLHLPVVFEKSNPATRRIIGIVDKLRRYHPQMYDVFHSDGISEEEIQVQRREWEVELDEAVFELYELNGEQIDLIRDLCDVTLPFFYRPFDSTGAAKAVERNELPWIENYIEIFCLRWNAYLGGDEGMRGEIHVGAHANMVAVEFYTADKGDPYELKVKDESWGYILDEIGSALPQPMGISQIILDGFVSVVSDSGIIIIKRNEKRFWTRSIARVDAEATISKRMIDTMPKQRRSH